VVSCTLVIWVTLMLCDVAGILLFRWFLGISGALALIWCYNTGFRAFSFESLVFRVLFLGFGVIC